MNLFTNSSLLGGIAFFFLSMMSVSVSTVSGAVMPHNSKALSRTTPSPAVAARAVLEALFEACGAKDTEAIRATLASNATSSQSDFLCSGPSSGQSSTLDLIISNYPFYQNMMRPIGSAVAFQGTDSDPSGGVSFAATFTDIGFMPTSIRNQTGTWNFLDQSMVTGELDRHQRLTKINFFMPWETSLNTLWAMAAKQYFNTMTTGTLQDMLALFTPNATVSGRGQPYLTSPRGQREGAYNMSMNLTEFGALMANSFLGRTHGTFELQSVTAGCGKAAVFNTVMSERYADPSDGSSSSSSSSGGGDTRKQFMAFGSHVFYFQQGTMLIDRMEWAQLENHYTT